MKLKELWQLVTDPIESEYLKAKDFELVRERISTIARTIYVREGFRGLLESRIATLLNPGLDAQRMNTLSSWQLYLTSITTDGLGSRQCTNTPKMGKIQLAEDR